MRGRSTKPRAWPWLTEARGEDPAYVTASRVLLGLHSHPDFTPQVGVPMGTGKGGLCCSPRPGQGVGGLAPAPSRTEWPPEKSGTHQTAAAAGAGPKLAPASWSQPGWIAHRAGDSGGWSSVSARMFGAP